MNKNVESLKIFCDGGSRRNPGPAASAFVAMFGGRVVFKDSKYLGKATNNVAEYEAVVMALDWLIKDFIKGGTTPKNISFYLDSELVVKQIGGQYKVKSESMRRLYLKVKKLEQKIKVDIDYNFIRRSKNRLADCLVNKELNGKRE